MKEYDLIAIGTGSAGSNAASECKKAGWKVAIIDSRPFGGTCALRGCDPKKVLVGAAEIIDRSADMKGRGIDEVPKLNWSELMKFKRTFTEQLPKRNEEGFINTGIDVYHGKATFIGKDSIRIDKDEIKAKHIVIASGDKPMRLNIPGQEHVTISDDFLELDELPKDIIFIGGGYISFEFAHIAARGGAKVKILHKGKRPLKNFDQNLVKMLLEEFQEIGIDVILNAPVDSIEKKGNTLVVKSAGKEYETLMAVHGAGRVPNVDDLDLSKAGVEYDIKGVKVNEYLQTSNPFIYAGGDCASIGLPLTPVASMHGRVIAKNLLEGNKTKADHTATASVVFTYPPLASVGLTEEQAKNKGIKFKAKFSDASSWYNPKRVGIKRAGYNVLVDENEQIIGAHVLYPRAEDVINIFVLAMKQKMKLAELENYLFGYPSDSYDAKYMV